MNLSVAYLSLKGTDSLFNESEVLMQPLIQLQNLLNKEDRSFFSLATKINKSQSNL